MKGLPSSPGNIGPSKGARARGWGLTCKGHPEGQLALTLWGQQGFLAGTFSAQASCNPI